MYKRQVGDGVAAKAKEESKLAIHVDADKDSQQPGYILTSVIKNTEVPVFDITKSYTEGKIKEIDVYKRQPVGIPTPNEYFDAIVTSYLQEPRVDMFCPPTNIYFHGNERCV